MSNRENQNDAEELGSLFFAAAAVIGVLTLLFCAYGLITHIIDYVL